jgi:hypothetical protein
MSPEDSQKMVQVLRLDPDGRLERFRKLAYEAGMRAERAACADICDQHASIEGIAQRCAAEIRARNNP